MDRLVLGYTGRMAPRERAVQAVQAALLAAACEVVPPDDDVTPSASTESGLAPCVQPESAFFAADLAPAPADERAELACEIAGRAGGAGSFVLDLACGGATAQLVVELAPAPAGDGFSVGQAIRVTSIRAPGELGAADRWLRVEDAKGRLLLAYVAGARLDPPDGTPWALPFVVGEAASACMVEETACGASQRGAVDLRLSGGAPVRLYEGTSEVVGDKGAYVAHVAAARSSLAGSACPRQWQLGLLAQR